MRYLVAAFALFLVVVVVTACEPTVGVDFKGFPECPTSDSVYYATPTVPLGCPLPTAPPDTTSGG